ncbi:hypothetical protein H8B15_20200 [Hymenobacter sp. BT507]|uniref:Uncharacterized protein n=1 Tax=Hymenobacter citatus TaxID=2763506 RepID=A0ABR7MR84_9BACT|nr:hypothetical protein [Hymenobacter citatus]MBC6613255.1 hypothetical protein [Hymenobacter citatus]
MALSNRPFPLTLAALCLLSIPFVVAQFTNGVVWSVANFILAGILLLGAGLLYLLAVSTARNGAY